MLSVIALATLHSCSTSVWVFNARMWIDIGRDVCLFNRCQ